VDSMSLLERAFLVHTHDALFEESLALVHDLLEYD